MSDDKLERAIALGTYIVQNACTVRDCALRFCLGKSTVHKEVTERLALADPELCDRVRRVLDYNLSVRHLRGGEATRQKNRQRRTGA